MIAKPFSPGNAFPAEEVARGAPHVRQGDDRIVHQRQLRRSAVRRARRSRGARAGHLARPRRSSSSFRAPAASAGRSSGPTRGSAANRSPRCFARSAARSVESWCGPCFGQGPDALEQGPARDHLVQPQLAESDGRRRRRVSREPRGRRRLGAARLHGAARRARSDVEPGRIRRVTLNSWVARAAHRSPARRTLRCRPRDVPRRFERPRARLGRPPWSESSGYRTVDRARALRRYSL